MLVKRLQAEEGFVSKACLQLFCQVGGELSTA